MKIGQLADAVGVSVETVRYYERRGLLAPPVRTDAGYRQYDQGDVARLQLLLRAKQLGFTLSEIAELFVANDAASTIDVAVAVRSKLAAIDVELVELTATRNRLLQLVELCEH